VLYRTDAGSGPLLQALTRAGLPFQKHSHDRLADRPGVQLLMHELRLAMPDPAGPDPAGPDPAGPFRAGPQEPAETALLRVARAVAGRFPATASEATDVRAAAEVLRPLARRCGSDLDRFRTEIALGAEADAADPRADSVALLTLHAAKGLEFEVVFLAGCEHGLLPLRLPGAAPQGHALRAADVAEERRLLFVGMTRARTRLLLTCARRRTRWGAERAAGPSPFLAAIDADLLTRSTSAARRRSTGRQLRLL
jgi:superfamily I DNA/RNA helicase